MIGSTLRQWFSALATPTCPACTNPLEFGAALWCDECQQQTRLLAAAGLTKASSSLPGVWPVLACSAHQGPLRRLLVRAKEESNAPGLVLLKQQIFDLLQQSRLEPGALVAVPPGKYRRWRGHYLATELARHLARKSAWGGGGLSLYRRGWRHHQVGLGGEQRRSNLVGTIGVRKWPQIPPTPRVWLIDDVCTTGSTLIECGRVLHAAGVARVGALVLTRVS